PLTELFDMSQSFTLGPGQRQLIRDALTKQLANTPLTELFDMSQSFTLGPGQRQLIRDALTKQLTNLPKVDVGAASKVLDPLVPRLAGLTLGASGLMSGEVIRRAGAASAAVLERLSEPDSPDSLDALASEVAEAPGYAELWDSVQHEVETLLHEDTASSAGKLPAGDEKNAATWHVSWLLFSLRASLPSDESVEAFMNVASGAVLALVACAVLRSAYPSVWAELDAIELTPFTAAAYLYGAIGHATRKRDSKD
ncbi:hypothetical protein, partial [Actinoplanes missouriensis]|uniref:hypothetical protein n=1 Tax=Actinoplanes missouriensis TaxID=1866 RepID=UPI00369A7D25